MNYLKWILMLIEKLLPADKAVDLIVKVLKILAAKTDNKVDDALVDIVAEMLYSAFGSNKDQKLADLDQQFSV